MSIIYIGYAQGVRDTTDEVVLLLQFEPEYEIGDKARVVVKEKGVTKTKQVEIVERLRRGTGKWVYQVKSCDGGVGGEAGGSLLKDEKGNHWFNETELGAWK